MSTIKADNFTWKSGELGGQPQYTVSADKVILGTVKTWLNYAGQSYSINKSFNVSSTTRSSAGSYQANFITAFTDAYYSCSGGCSVEGSNAYWLTAMSFGDYANTYGLRTVNSLAFFTVTQPNTKYDNNTATLLIIR